MRKQSAMGLAMGVLLSLTAGGATALPARAEAPVPAAKDALTLPGQGALKIEGYLGHQLDVCLRNRVAVQKLDALVAPFRDRKETGDDDRRCEYAGAWMESMALGAAYQPTDDHRKALAAAAKALCGAAGEDGYISTRSQADRLKGWDAAGSAAVLTGLLAAAERVDDKDLLQAAQRHADALLAALNARKAKPAELGPACLRGLAGSMLVGPMARLYLRTGEKKYLDLAQATVEHWSQPTALAPRGLRLIEAARDGTAPAAHCPVGPREQLICLAGLLDLYRATGEAKHLQAVVRFAELILQHEATIVGPGGADGRWANTARRQTLALDRPLETSVSAAWIVLLGELFKLTGEVRWADEMEKTLLNGLMAAMAADGSWWAGWTSLMGERVPGRALHEDVALGGFVVEGPRALLRTPQWAVMSSAEGPVVNLYFTGTADLTTPKGQAVRLVLASEYPRKSSVRVEVQLREREEFTLALRVPGWSEQTALAVKGEAADARAGEMAKIKRLWRDGDTVELTLDMRARVVDAPDGNGFCALMRGPIVLAMDSRLVPAVESIRSRASLDKPAGGRMPLMLANELARLANVLLAAETPFVVDGQKKTLLLCDFASAGNQFSSRNLFRTYLPPALNMGRPYATGVEWDMLSPPGTRVRPKAPGK